MGIYIRGMEMPKRGHTITITIVGGGQAYVEYFDCRPHVEETIEYTAVHVPPHGRLGDLDALKAKAIERSEKCGEMVNVLDKVITAYDISTAPTVIPAEEV